MRQIISNTPQDSGLGDSLFIAFNKVNAMTLELYNQDVSFSGELQTISAIVDTINDGVSTLNHKHTLDQIIGLQIALSGKVSTSTFNTQIAAINASIVQINSTISDIIDELQTKVDEAPFSGITYGRNDGEWVPIQESSFTGGTVNGATVFNSGLTATTISATTYQNVPIPTLQQVQDNNHDLVDGIFTVGTLAGQSSTGTSQNFLGYGAGFENTGTGVNALGYAAGVRNAGGYQNALGEQAGYENTAINQNALGFQAGQGNSSDNQNALGSQAGYANSGSSQNALGFLAGYENAGDNQNALGFNAGFYNAGAYQNALGENAGYENQGDNQNALGFNAGYGNSSDNQNAFGYEAGQGNSSINQNVMGNFAGGNNTGDNQNSFGQSAGAEQRGESQNALGYFAGYDNAGNYQNALGYQAGVGNSSDNQNAMGFQAGAENQGFNQNAFGYQAGYENAGDNVNAFGGGAGLQNTGDNQNLFGESAGSEQIGESQNAMGYFAGYRNQGDNVNALGFNAGFENTFNNVNLFGQNAQADENGQTVLSKDGTIMARISTTLMTDTRQYTFPDKDGIFAMTVDIPTNTSDLINDGEDGTSPYVTANQLPSNLNLFATNVSSDIATYFKLVTSIDDPDYNDTAVNIPTGAITTTGQFIAALATTANVLVGNPGIINLLTIGNVRRTSGSGTAEFYYEVYHRTSGGTETLIATSSSTPPVSTAIYTEFLAAALLNNGVFLATDRIVVKYYADRIGSGSNPQYDFQFGGISPVRTTFPVPSSNIPLDATPTSGSTNGVQSGGVFNALATKFELPALTNGSVLFSNGTTIVQDNTNLFWDDANNRLGIGTNNPSAYYAKKLVVSAIDEDGITLAATSTSATNYIAFADGIIGNQTYRGYIFYRHLSDSFGFGTSGQNRMTIDSGGSIGIGTTSPQARLDVRAQGALSTDIAFRVRNSADSANLIQVNGAGGVAINSTTQGFLPPRMTNAQRLAITTPAVGLIVYCTDATEGLYENTSTGWVNLNSNSPLQVTPITLSAASWTLVSGLYEYDYSNANITSTSIVDVIPSNSTIAIVQTAGILPSTISSAGSVKLFSNNLPTGDITVTFNIFN